MLWWYLSPSPNFYSDWLWPYCGAMLNFNRSTSNPEWGKCQWAVFEKTSLESQISEWPLASVYTGLTKLLKIYWFFMIFIIFFSCFIQAFSNCLLSLVLVFSCFIQIFHVLLKFLCLIKKCIQLWIRAFDC